MILRFLQEKWPEIFGVTPSKLQAVCEKVKPPGVPFAQGGDVKGDGGFPGLVANELIMPCSASRRQSLAPQIKTIAVTSAPGVTPYLRVSFKGGGTYVMGLDGPALFNLNNEVASALSCYLHKPDGVKL